MVWALLFLVVCLLIAGSLRERYTDPEFPVARPEKNGIWLSKIDSQAPIGGDDDAYLEVLQAFYDKVYKPAATKPKDTDVEAFLKSPDVNRPGIDIDTVRKIIGNSFRTESTLTAAQREEKQVVFQATDALQPQDGRDEVYNRTEDLYVPADGRIGELPEGIYLPVSQQDEPRRPGVYDDRSTSWTKSSFYSVCEGGPCEQNVL